MQRLVLLTAFALPAPALACGGLFCDTSAPVDQAGEQIVFGVDAGSGTTTVHVQVTYEGRSEDFAWVVPVPAEPELGVSSQSLFTTLSGFTRPIHSLRTEYTGDCDWRDFSDSGIDFDAEADTDTDFDTDADAGSGVTVVAQQQVGPYDTVTLQATSAEALLTWLQEAEYDLPSTLDGALAPYVASGQYFVALKLSSGSDSGDLRPLAMTYAGTAASIPLQLTSVAATPDMRLTVYVLGVDRAVPDNYLHVIPNDAAIDWFSGGSNYNDVITLAADEAGGQAFATDYSAALSASVWNDRFYNSSTLRAADGPLEWFDAVVASGLPANAQLLDVLLQVIPIPPNLAAQGVTPQVFFNCLDCYASDLDTDGFSAEAATDLLEAELVDGLRAANALVARHDHITRLTSSMDASEMTVDPMFVFNPSVRQRVEQVRTATVTVDCDAAGNGEVSDAPRTLTLPDGRILPLPSENDLQQQGLTEFEALDQYASPAALVIEDLGPTGTGTIIADFRDAADDQLDSAGCSCQSAPTPWGALWVGLVGLTALVRRRRRSPSMSR